MQCGGGWLQNCDIRPPAAGGSDEDNVALRCLMEAGDAIEPRNALELTEHVLRMQAGRISLNVRRDVSMMAG